ncbi:hypothetical protein PG984_005590 [Apiospora sp. TS-2023a]
MGHACPDHSSVLPTLPEVRKAQADLRQARKCVAPLVDESMQKCNQEKKQDKVKVAAGAHSSPGCWRPSPTTREPPSGWGSTRWSCLHIEPLRAEIEEVIKEYGMLTDENGHGHHLSKSSFQKLVKLDSFI